MNGSRRFLRLGLQALGFGLGVAMLAWCATVALRGDNRAQFARLAEAPWWATALLVALSGATLLLNGACFWLALRPVHRLRIGDVEAVNAIAALLALLPFKLSLLFRVLVHRQRDGVPVLTIGAWFGVTAALMLAVMGPAALAATMSGTSLRALSAAWWAVVLGGTAAASVAIVSGARWLRGGRAWALVERIAGLVPGARLRALVVLRVLPRAHEAVRMLGSPATVGGSAVLRLSDLGVQTARFLVAAMVLERAMTLEQAVLAASVYFLIGAVAPTGSLGVREAGTVGLFRLLDAKGFEAIVLVVSAADAIVLLLGASLGAAWLRPDRLLRRAGTGAVSAPAVGAPAPAARPQGG